MRDLSDIKAAIRRQMIEKEKKKSSLRKRLRISLSVISTALVLLCTTVIIANRANDKKYAFIPIDNIKMYDQLEDLVFNSDLILVVTVKDALPVTDKTDSPVKTETKYYFEIERRIVGTYDKNTIEIITKEGTINDLEYCYEGCAPYIVGESYFVFLKRPDLDIPADIYEVSTSTADDKSFFEETTPLQGRIRIIDSHVEIGNELNNKTNDLDHRMTVEELSDVVKTIICEKKENL